MFNKTIKIINYLKSLYRHFSQLLLKFLMIWLALAFVMKYIFSRLRWEFLVSVNAERILATYHVLNSKKS